MGNTTTTTDDRVRENMGMDMTGCVSQFYVFSGETYLGWDCFDSPSVKVGGSAFADLCLDDPDIDDIQAEFRIQNGRITVVNRGREGGVTVNNRAVSECRIGSFDVVKIGRFTVKAKLKKMSDLPMAPEPVEQPVVAGESSPPVTETVAKENQGAAKEIHLVQTDCSENPPAIVKDLLDIMDKGRELDFEDIEDILTSKASEIRVETQAARSSVPRQATSEVKEGKRQPVAVSDLAPVVNPPVKPGARRPSPYDLVLTDRKSGTDDMTVSGGMPEAGLEHLENTTFLPTDRIEESGSEAVKQSTDRTLETVKTSGKKQPRELECRDSRAFPPAFYASVHDDEDEEEDDDMSANFTLREMLVGDRAGKGSETGEGVLEVIKFRGGNVISIAHVKNQDEHMLVNGKETFCRLHYEEASGAQLVFTQKLLGTINRVNDKELRAEMADGKKTVGSRKTMYNAFFPVKGELTLSDGFYDFVIRKSLLPPDPAFSADVPAIPLRSRVMGSTAFKYGSRAFLFHLILLFVLSFTVKMPDKSEFKDPETFFVKLDTEDIRKPVKPIPRPKPVLPLPSQPVDKPATRDLARKEAPKETMKTAAREPAVSKDVSSRPDTPDAGGEKPGNVANKNVNNVGLLASLGKKTGISLSPNEALASVSNIDAVTSTRGHEANVRVGNIVSGMGDSRIAISSGGPINNKGGAGVYRSAGIGGKGSVAALSSGTTGKRAVKAVVAAPVAKKVKASGGGISRDAVAKVINDHMDEINACYESALVNDPSLMGRVEFEWTILQSGYVGDVKIKSSTVKSSQIHACIISSIKSWKFPQPQGADVVVSYPFVFDVTGF